MEVADARTHAVLHYIDLLTQRGYQPALDEVAKYESNLERTSAQVLMRNLAELFYQTALDYVQKVGWIEVLDNETRLVELTALGKSVLDHLNEQEQILEPASVVVLDDSDPLSYARFVKEIATYDTCMLADPYFRFDSLPDIVQHTHCTRILTSKRLKPEEISALSVALRDLDNSGEIEIRICKQEEFHDRFILPNSGSISFIGTSANSIGRKFSLIGKIKEPVAELIRAKYEQLWREATCLSSSSRPEERT